MRKKMKLISLTSVSLLLAACGSTEYYKNRDTVSDLGNNTPFFERIGDAFSDGFYFLLSFIEHLFHLAIELFFNLIALWPFIIIGIVFWYFNRKRKAKHSATDTVLNIEAEEEPIHKQGVKINDTDEERITLTQDELDKIIQNVIDKNKES